MRDVSPCGAFICCDRPMTPIQKCCISPYCAIPTTYKDIKIAGFSGVVCKNVCRTYIVGGLNGLPGVVILTVQEVESSSAPGPTYSTPPLTSPGVPSTRELVLSLAKEDKLTLLRTVQVRLGTNPLRLPGCTPIFVASRQQLKIPAVSCSPPSADSKCKVFIPYLL